LSHTRLDIAYVVAVVNQFMHNPKETHLKFVYHILHYLKRTYGKGNLFTKGNEMILEANTNVDYASSIDDRRSTTDIALLGRNLVTWEEQVTKCLKPWP